jgi:hypothetical protein
MKQLIKNKEDLTQEIIDFKEDCEYINFNRLDDSSWDAHISMEYPDPNANYSIKLNRFLLGTYDGSMVNHYNAVYKKLKDFEIKLEKIVQYMDKESE